jgi:hypothetical protein
MGVDELPERVPEKGQVRREEKDKAKREPKGQCPLKGIKL